MRIGRGMAVPLSPGGEAAAVPAFEASPPARRGRRRRGRAGWRTRRRPRTRCGSSSPRPCCRRPATESTERSRADAGLAGPGVAEHQAHDVDRVGEVGPQRLGPQLDLVAEHDRHLEGVAGAAEEPQRRRPPRGGALRLRRAPAASARCWPSTVARSWEPGGWPNAWSWATASSAAISTRVTSVRTSATVDGPPLPGRSSGQLLHEGRREPLLVALGGPNPVDHQQSVELGGHQRVDQVGRVALPEPGPEGPGPSERRAIPP